MDFQRWLREAAGELSESESPKRDAEILLEHVTGKARTYLLAFGETELTAEQEAQLGALLARRKTGEPVAHLVGEREFWSLPLYVSAATLIPRPDTECLVEQALARLPAAACCILDLGTGARGYRAGAGHRAARLRGDGGGCNARCGGAGAA